MFGKALFSLLLFLSVTAANAQLFGNGPRLSTLKDLSDGKFQFESVRSVFWPQIVNEGRNFLIRTEKTWVPARLFMPAGGASKLPAMVIMHGIGGLYTRDGSKRAYWDYAELLAANGIASLVIDTHGARGVGASGMLANTDVSVYTFVADAFLAADMLRTHGRIDPARIGLMGFSKGGMTTLLATDKRFVNTFSATASPFALHIPVYPGCQNFPERLQATGAPVHMLLGEKDNYTGTSSCFEVEAKLKASGVPVQVTLYKGAIHSWDESFRPMRIDDVSSEDCRWVLKDGGAVWGGGDTPLNTAAEGQAYFRRCTKSAEIFVGRVEPANTEGRRAVVETVKAVLGQR